MTDLSRDDLLHLIATRHEMIGPICGGTLEKQTIEEVLDISRPTVDRAFRELEELGLLESTGTTYGLTRFGRLFCDRFDDQLDQIDEMVDLADLLSHLPESASIDDRLLSGAEVIQTEKHAPLTPISEVSRLIETAKEVAGYSNVILPHYVSFVHERVLDEGMSATIVLSEGVMERALSDYMAELGELMEADHFTLVKSTESLPYGFVVVDGETVGVAIRDGQNHLRGALLNYTDEAVEWAREHLDSLVAGGEEYEFTRSAWSVRAD